METRRRVHANSGKHAHVLQTSAICALAQWRYALRSIWLWACAQCAHALVICVTVTVGNTRYHLQLKPWTPAGSRASAGQVKVVKNFTFLRIYDAGHMVPMDKPKEALEMFSEFLTNDVDHNHLRHETDM
eukprot:GHVS01082637.1.p1 GENE.GHVS01082637.1~~GHVS01082637.1.p1  ORF type:complete len:130 (+),score=2.47 GHVS01082637.1:181-570(+)